MYDHIDEIVALGKRFLDLTTKVNLGEETPERVISLCLHGRMVDLSSAVAALLKSHDVAGIPHLVRGQLEAYADFRNLKADPKYVRNMEAACCVEVECVLRAVTREGFDQAGIPDVAANLRAAQARIAELKKEGATSLKIADRFRKANLITDHYSVYAYLCSHSHNNITALEERHIDKSVEPHQLRILLDEIDAELAILVELSLKIPMASLGILLEGTKPEEYKKLCTDFENARKKWSHLLSPTRRPSS